MASTLENALRLVKPGEMVVSLTDILDKLGDKITPAEREQLLIAMLSPRREKVQPGDLISSDLLNVILADIADIKVQLAVLQKSSGGGVVEPIVGYIMVSYKGSKRGTNLVPNDPKPFPHTFSIANATNLNLEIQLDAKVTGASGDWSKSVVFENNSPTSTLSVLTKTVSEFDVLISAPATGTVLNEKPVITVTASSGKPYNKTAQDVVTLLVTNTVGGEVVRSLRFETASFPGGLGAGNGGIDATLPKGEDRTLSLKFKYDDNSAAPPDPAFDLVVTLDQANPPASVSQWGVMPMAASGDSDTTASNIRTVTMHNVAVPRGISTPIDITFSAPSVNSSARFTVSLRSTKLPEVITVSSRAYVIATS